MSGHSKWSKIKRQKKAADIEKGKIYSRLAKSIALAVQKGGKDPEMNFKLRAEIDKAKEENMPKDTIERAIKKGAGELEDGTYEKVTYEAVGDEGVGIIIECTTDNKNRTVSQIRNILKDYSFNLSNGGVAWQFDTIGKIIIKVEEQEDITNTALSLMDIEGVKDVKTEKNFIYVFTTIKELEKVAKKVEEQYQLEKKEITKKLKNKIVVSKSSFTKAKKVIKDLSEHEDVDNIWNNINI